MFDASAVLAIALREQGYRTLLGLEGVALVSAVNLTEVRSRLWDKSSSANRIDEALVGIDMSIIAFDAEQGKLAADLRRRLAPWVSRLEIAHASRSGL